MQETSSPQHCVTSKRRLLAISSGGGHWEQMMLIKEAFVEFEVYYANTIDGLGAKSEVSRCTVVSDCNRNDIKSILKSIKNIRELVTNIHPDVVVSTGAMPGLLAMVFGKLSGASCVWVDSIANAEKMSLSGKIASLFCDLCIVQWSHVASKSSAKTKFVGSVL